ncbi:MAG: hypothetical protein COB09_04945 [Thalassobium sp.]|nr:MAG: hypothetical protein COB09_04945 [Thalassobium sp.]
MRFHRDGPSIPDLLLERCDAGRVVFLCGAGVSVPAGLPDFKKLTQQVINFFDPAEDSEIRKTFNEENPPLDKVFHLLYQEFVKSEVDAFVAEQLRKDPSTLITSEKHELIKRISSGQSGYPQIVTTNFDRLFELSSDGNAPKTHKPPALPDVSLGSEIEGITYLHGQLADNDSEHHEYVLSSADFGRAYLSEGWATEFVRNLLKHYTVVLLGYRAEDPPVKYLLQGLNHDSQYDRSRLYAFGRGRAEDIEAEWRDRGVTAIAYNERDDLWQTLEAWAERKDSPRRWLESVIASACHDPKSMEPHERGQVVHALRTARGAKLFASANPVPHPEWICVLDARVRSAEPSKSYGPESEEFDPRAAYGLDDDQETLSDYGQRKIITNDDLLVWREGDDNPVAVYSLAGRQTEGHEEIPIRLGFLLEWIVRSADSPVIAWWVAQKNGLNSRLLQRIEWSIKHSKDLPERAAHIWHLIIEHHRYSLKVHDSVDWYELKDRVSKEGWTPSVLRSFRKATFPRIVIQQSSGIAKSKPPSLAWDEIGIGDIAWFEVEIMSHRDGDIEIPDEVLPGILRILEDQFHVASGLLADTENPYFETPTCYPDREVEGSFSEEDSSFVFRTFITLFDRLLASHPGQAAAMATLWPANEPLFFRKLKLYALSKAAAFEANRTADILLSFDQESFWDQKVVRELLFLLEDRWAEFSAEHQYQLMERILAGPDRQSFWTDDGYTEMRAYRIASYATYLKLKGAEFLSDQLKRLAEVVNGIADWKDSLAEQVVVAHGSYGGVVQIDESPEDLVTAPVGQVLTRVNASSKREFGSLIERRPFNGLIKENPRKAMLVLTRTARQGEYPLDLWRALLENLSDDIPTRLSRIFLVRVLRLPNTVIADLRHELGRWIHKSLVRMISLDEALGWAVYDHIVDSLIEAGEAATKSSIGGIRRGGKALQRSRRTYGYAINGPLGHCTQALIFAVSGDTEASGLLSYGIKDRLERLFSAPGEGADHAVSIVIRQLNWLMHIDPAWTSEKLLPMLNFDHPLAEPAWDSLLRLDRLPTDEVLQTIRPLLSSLMLWVNQLAWEQQMLSRAAQWLGSIYLFRDSQPELLTKTEMKNALRTAADEVRNQFIHWLGRVGQGNENGWVELVIPFIQNVWPKESKYRTTSSVSSWLHLLNDTNDCFPMVYEEIRNFLIPVSHGQHSFYRFTRNAGEDESLIRRFPETVLDMMNRITPQVHSLISADLPSVLTIIAESNPELLSDVCYLRLIDLVENA